MVNLKATSEDLEELNQMFLKLDTSKDGLLSLEEISVGLEQVYGKLKGNAAEYAEIMKNLDKDGNGFIDYNEYITAAIDKAAMLNKDNLKAAFDLLDTDNSGMITIDELKAAFDSHGDHDESLWREIMNEVDKNKDGQISF